MNDDGMEREKLLRARHEILEVLTRYDLCASVILLGRHRMGKVTHLDATWSNLSTVRNEDGHDGLCLRSKSADYHGDQTKRHDDLEATVGMVRALAELYAMDAMAWIDASERFDAKTGAEHTPLTREHKQ